MAGALVAYRPAQRERSRRRCLVSAHARRGEQRVADLDAELQAERRQRDFLPRYMEVGFAIERLWYAESAEKVARASERLRGFV